MRNGVRLALDLGLARVGVARCDGLAMMSFPHDVVAWTDVESLAAYIRNVVNEYDVLECVVGLPLDLQGNESIAAIRVREVSEQLAQLIAPLPVRIVDERLTTKEARRSLQAAGHTTRTDKKLIDAAAATVLLEHTLEAERRTGHAPGEIVE